jgi:hypothetical protein
LLFRPNNETTQKIVGDLWDAIRIINVAIVENYELLLNSLNLKYVYEIPNRLQSVHEFMNNPPWKLTSEFISKHYVDLIAVSVMEKSLIDYSAIRIF